MRTIIVVSFALSISALLAVGQGISVLSVEAFPSLPPALAELPNRKEITRTYTTFVFDLGAQRPYLPLAWQDQRGVNFGLPHLALPAYVGDHRYGRDGTQEAINVVAAVRSATLVGLDMSQRQGLDLVTMQKEFFARRNGQNLVLNNPSTVIGGSFWYEIYPNIFFILADQYPHLAQAKQGLDDLSFLEIVCIVAERWEEALSALADETGVPNFFWQAFGFSRMEPVFRWQREPDAAAGVAWLLCMAYVTFGEDRFLAGAERALDFLRELGEKGYNPLYEPLLPYGALVAARLNPAPCAL